MSDFYKLTDSILVEYVKYNEVKDEPLAVKYPEVSGNYLSLSEGICVVKDGRYYNRRYIFSDNFQDTFNGMTTNVSMSNTVMSTKINGGKFIDPNFSGEPCYLDIDNKFTPTADMVYHSNERMYYDTVTLYFTRSGLNLSAYKGYVLEIRNVTTAEENDVILASIRLDADTRYILCPKPEVIDGKLYVKKIVLRIPSVAYIAEDPDIESFRNACTVNDLNNSYNKISLIGITNKIVSDGIFTNYDTEVITAANVVTRTISDIGLDVKPSGFGEYFEINTLVNDGRSQLSDLFRSKYDSFVLDYEITLKEHYIAERTYDVNSLETSRVNVIKHFDIGDVSDETEECDEQIIYRPVLKTHNTVSFDINVTLKITSVSDGSIYTYNASCSYGTGEGENVSNYGKRIKAYISSSANLLSVNVFNKRDKSDEMKPVLQNSSVTSINRKATTVEIASFIETADIQVSVSDVNVSDITLND